LALTRLYVMRHGHSPSPREAGVNSDFERPLSEAGRRAVKAAAEHLAAKGGTPLIILHSPLLRAAQTAAAAAAVLKPASGLEVFQPLKNELPAAELTAELKQRCSGFTEVLAVGHQPQLGELVAFLTGMLTELRPGGMAALDMSGASPRLLWSRNPS
jgi:phosphohistidine phosphatase